jgi:hypothetical protein
MNVKREMILSIKSDSTVFFFLNRTIFGLAEVAIFTTNVDAENYPESFRDD